MFFFFFNVFLIKHNDKYFCLIQIKYAIFMSKLTFFQYFIYYYYLELGTI